MLVSKLQRQSSVSCGMRTCQIIGDDLQVAARSILLKHPHRALKLHLSHVTDLRRDHPPLLTRGTLRPMDVRACLERGRLRHITRVQPHNACSSRVICAAKRTSGRLSDHFVDDKI
jgi:hypothetical protein